MSDDFESEYMTGDEHVRHRDKRVSRGMAGLLGIWAPFCWALAIFIGYANAGSSNPVPDGVLPFIVAGIAGLGLMFAVMAVSFAVLRTVVTETHVNVKYGLWGPSIEIGRIKSCNVVDYDWSQFGGWGIRRGMGGKWAYVPGPGEVVEIAYEDGDAVKTVQVGAQDARKLSLEINRARNELTRVRIETDHDAEAKAELELAAEEEADLAEQRRKT